MNVKVIHTTIVDSNKEKIICKVCQKVSNKVKLPKQITVIVKELEPSIYAETNLHNAQLYRIVLNSRLTIHESIKPLVHELLHLNQIYTGKLQSKRGVYIWEGIEYKVKNGLSQTYEDYQSMPWELDVNQNLPKLLEILFTT